MSRRHPIKQFQMEVDEADEIGNELHIDLWYPDYDLEKTKKFVVGLMAVRAADSIRVSYDFDRDGWKIEQATIFEWELNDEVCDRGWKEVAFVQAWQFDNREEDQG